MPSSLVYKPLVIVVLWRMKLGSVCGGGHQLRRFPKLIKILLAFSKDIIDKFLILEVAMKETMAKRLFNPEISSQSQGYISHWLIWLVHVWGTSALR